MTSFLGWLTNRHMETAGLQLRTLEPWRTLASSFTSSVPRILSFAGPWSSEDQGAYIRAGETSALHSKDVLFISGCSGCEGAISYCYSITHGGTKSQAFWEETSKKFGPSYTVENVNLKKPKKSSEKG